MSDARDRYIEAFTEKLWHWMPEVFRNHDTGAGPERTYLQSWMPAIGTSNELGPLYAFLRSLAHEAAVLKRSQDRLWSDHYVELADDWAIPYIADLVATRLVSALNARARRVDVAKTIYYRRRKGTLPVLEQLIADMTGWDGVVAEEFRRLGRHRHGLDPRARRGRITGTPEGGWADLRHPRGALLALSPFDEFHYTPDVRKPAGSTGRHGISKLGLHVYRLTAVELALTSLTPATVSGVTPRRLGSIVANIDRFTFDPSGRDVPLFATNSLRADFTTWHSALEWELPAAISCRLLGEATFTITPAEVAAVRVSPALAAPLRNPTADELAKLVGTRFLSEADLRIVLASRPLGANLVTPGVLFPMMATAIEADCGKAGLLPASSTDLAGGSVDVIQTAGGVSTVAPRVDTDAGYLGVWPAVWPPPAEPPPVRPLRIDPDRGRFVLDRTAQPAATVSVRVVVGMAGRVGAGGYPRDIPSPAGPFTQWLNGSSAAGIHVSGLTDVADSATYAAPPNQLLIQKSRIVAAAGRRPFVRLAANWRLGAGVASAELTLDGLWIGASAAAQLRIEGDFEIVTINSCTLDPGGVDADGGALPPVPLVITGHVNHLRINRSVLNEVRLAAGAVLDEIEIADSIIQVQAPGTAALAFTDTDTRIVRSTVLAARPTDLVIDVDQLYASELLCTGRIDVTNTQAGCFRFSVRVSGSRVPHPYRSHEITSASGLFTSTRFGDPGFAQLSEIAPEAFVRGAENGAEIGAFANEINPIKQDSLVKKVEEYMPFGLLPFVVHEN